MRRTPSRDGCPDEVRSRPRPSGPEGPPPGRPVRPRQRPLGGSTEIPADRGRYGTFDILREPAEEHVRTIIEQVAAGDAAPGSVARKVGDLYASFMAEEDGRAPRRGPAGRLARSPRWTRRRAPCCACWGRSAARASTGWSPHRQHRRPRPRRYIVYLEQAGLGLPDESYYREDTHARPARPTSARRPHARPRRASGRRRPPPSASWRSRPGSPPATGTRWPTGTPCAPTPWSTGPP